VSAETKAAKPDAGPFLSRPATRRATVLGYYAITTLGILSFLLALVVTFARVVDDDGTVEPIDSYIVPSTPPDVRLQHPAADDGRAATLPETSDAPPEATVVRWREEVKLRRAAGVLLLADDYEGAMELLLQISAEDSRAFALDRAAHRRILKQLRPTLLEERRSLSRFLAALQLFGPSGESGLDDDEAREMARRFVALPAERVHLPECAASLPDRVALTFMRNVHLRLARTTRANDTLLALILGLGLSQGSDAARVYWEEFPSEFAEYDEAL